MFDSLKLGMLVRQIRIALLPLLLLLASAPVLAQAPRLTLSVDQGVSSGELRLVRRSEASGSSRSFEGLAVSPDGRWLFNAGSNLEVWEIDSARGIVTQRMSSPQSGFSRGLAVSRDSSLVFVPNRQNNQITVFRLNADEGRLEEVAKYTEGGTDAAGNTVSGLTDASDVVPSPDGRLLFVTSREALSVWSIGTTGTLTQTDVHASAQAAGAAVAPDGRLLFAGSFHDRASSNNTLSIWRVNAEASTVSLVRTLRNDQRLGRPRNIALRPSGRLLFVANFLVGPSRNYLSAYRVNAAGENLERADPGLRGDPVLADIAAAEEALIASDNDRSQILLLRINQNDTVSLVSREPAEASVYGVAASPAGGLAFANSLGGVITVWQVLGIPRVPAGQEVRVMVNAERALGSALTVTVQARQGSRVSTAAATLTLSDTRAEAVFSGGDLGQGEWIFSASVPADMENIADASTARATLRIGGPLIRISNLSGATQQGENLNIRVSTGGHPVLEDAPVTLRAMQAGARTRTAVGVLRAGQAEVTVTFAGRESLTAGDWLLSAESSTLPTDASSTLAVTVRPPPLIRLSNLSGVIPEGADLNIRVSAEGPPVPRDAEVTLRATQEGALPRTVMGVLRAGQTSFTVTFAGRNALTGGTWVLSAESSILLGTDANSTLAVTVIPPLSLSLSVNQGVPSGEMRLVQTDANTGLARGTAEGIAVSPDGRWLLASGDGGITVWEIDSVRGIVTQRSDRMGAGLGGRGLAVSRDSSLVFASDGADTSTISVWRLDADDGGLMEVAKYKEGSLDAARNIVRGLIFTSGVVLSPDDRLLFVTSSGESNNGALSVWSVNTSGTLVQTDVHVSAGASDTQGLNAIAGAAVTPDGRLLFAGSFHSNLDNSTLGIWRVNAEASTVSFVRTLSDRRMLQRPRVVTLGPDGRFLFVSSQVFNDAATDPLSVYEVNAVEENLVSRASYGEGISGNTIGLAATREVLAVAEFNQGSVALWQRNDNGTLRFVSRHDSERAIGLAASPAGGLVFSSSNLGSEGISVWRVQGIPRVPAGQEVRVMVNARRMPGSALTVIVQARQGSRVRTAAATLMPSDTQAEAVFSGSALGQGEWIFSASVPADMAGIVGVSAARATLRIGGPLIRLENLSGVILLGEDLNIRVSAEGAPVLEDEEVTLRATQEGTQPRTVVGLLRAGQTSFMATFADENALTEGNWVLSAESPILQTDADSMLAVTVLLPLALSLQETAEAVVPAGSTLGITVLANRPPTQTLTVTVQAVRTVTAPATVMTATVTAQLFAGEEMGNALFAGENALFPGPWVLTIAEIMPEGSAEVPAQQLQVSVGPSALGLSAPMDLLQGQEAVIEVDTEVALGVEVRVTVMATHADLPATTASAAAVLLPFALAAEARFPANMLSMVRRGTWNFQITAATPSVLITDTEEFPLVDFTGTTAALQVTEEPTLLLELPPQPVDPAQPVSIRLRKSAPVNEILTVDITAMRPFGGMILTRIGTAVLSPSDTVAAAVFGPEPEQQLSAGRWTLMASVRAPGTVPVFPSAATITVLPPLLRLERMGPASVAAGTPVTVRVEAEAMPEDEGLGVRVIARQAMRADRERSAVLGSGSDFSADVEFTSLPPGEWLLTAQAERPGTFRTEGATDTVTVQVAALTLTPVSERVPAAEPARLILGTVVPLGVAVNVNVAAEPVSSFLPQMTAVNLDAASTVTAVVYDPGELAPGIWNFSVQVMDADAQIAANVVDVSMATATLQVAAPLIRLSNLSGRIQQGAGLNISVRTEGMVPVAGDAEVTVRAAQEDAQPRTVTGSLQEGQTSVTVTFAGENALTVGDWVLVGTSAEPSILQTDANSSLAVTVRVPVLKLTLSVDQGVPLGEMRLAQTDNEALANGTEEGLAVSPDGRWLLASGGDSITVWEIDSARGMVTQRDTQTGAGLGGSGLAVNRDSSLVFASDSASISTISVWRLNTDGRLEEVAKYTGEEEDAARNTITGLTNVWDVVLSPDDRLLFVTSRGESDSAGGALSVWSVDPSGTLVQTEVHIPAGTTDTESLNRAAGAAVTPDGSLLFVGSYYDSFPIGISTSQFTIGTSTLGIWRVNAEASTVSFVRTLRDGQRLRNPRVVTLGPAGRFLFVSNQVEAGPATDPLSVYRVNAAGENLDPVASYGDDSGREAIGLAATREVLAVAEFSSSSVALWQRNDDGTLRFASRHDSASPVGLAASPAGGLVFSSSNDASEGITVWRVQGIPRVPAGQEVRVTVNAETALGPALTVIVQARQGSRISTAAATLMSPGTQAEAVFSGSALGQGEWMFSVSVPADMAAMADRTDLSEARATLRVGNPLIRLSNLSGRIPGGAALHIRISTEVPVLENAEVILRAAQEGTRSRTVRGLLREGQASVTVIFADGNALTEGDWVLSAESSTLPTDANSSLAVTVRPPLLKLTLSVDQGVQSGDLRLFERFRASGSRSSRQGIAVSPDGRWLINVGSNLEVWEIDSARGTITLRMSSGNRRISRGLAVSLDSRFVFVPDNVRGDGLAVFRLDADNGRLEEVETYTEGGQDAAGKTIRGLTNVWDVVPSPDGRLLFVTSGGGTDSSNVLGGALSVWSIGTSGTLTQTDVHVSAGAFVSSDTRGLNQAAGAAVTPDGRLLFVGSFYRSDNGSTLGIWRVNAAASTVSFVRTLSGQRLPRPQLLALHPSGRLLFVMNISANPSLSVYRVKAAEENLESVDSVSGGIIFDDITATEEVLITTSLLDNDQAFLFRINDEDSISLVDRRDSTSFSDDYGVAASPAGGMAFSNSVGGRTIIVWQVQGIPRVPAGQEVRVMVNAGQAPDSALTVMVQARQGSRVSTAAATLVPSGTQAEAVFSGSALGQGEWIFSASVPADVADTVDISAARATLRIGGPLIRLENLSGAILEGDDLTIRVSAEGAPVLEDEELTLRATREGAQPQTVTGLLQAGQVSFTLTFAGENALTEGDWVLSAESPILLTDADSTLAVTVRTPLPRVNLSLSVDQGAQSEETGLVQTDANPLASGIEEGLAVSPDGRWLLASGGGGITVWEIDSARGIVTQRSTHTGAGLGGRGLAVSRDSRLVFTSDGARISTISVWRLDADDGFLEEVAKYTGEEDAAAENTVTGLTFTHDVLLSPDNRLLFVTSRGESDGNVSFAGSALSVWRVNSSGTLVQTNVHIAADTGDIQGLQGAGSAAVSPNGRLLFVGSYDDPPPIRGSGSLGLWRVNADTSLPSVTFAGRAFGPPGLGRPRVVTLGPAGRFLFVSNQVSTVFPISVLSVYRVNAAGDGFERVATYGGDSFLAGFAIGLAATREVLAVAEFEDGVSLWQRNDDGTLRFASRHVSASPIGLAASPAGGLVFSSSSDASAGIGVWHVQGIPRVPAGQEVRVTVNAESAPGEALTVIVQARQGGRVRTAMATLMPSDTQADAVFPGSALGQGEWMFSASVPADMADRTILSAARGTLRIGGPPIRLSNLSGRILQGADLNIRVSAEGAPVLGDTEVTLQATLQESTQHRTVTGLLPEGQTSLTLSFVGENALTEGDWVLSATPSRLLSTDANSTLAVTVGPFLLRLGLSADQGVQSGETRLVQTDANTGLANGTEEGLAVSPDGRWLLASGGGGITVWGIDSARGMVTPVQTYTGAGLGGSGLAVNRDSSLVFASDSASISTISVWRLNADDGSLVEVAKYTGEGTDAAENIITGLTNVWDVVLSPDDRLLFVTSRGESDSAGGALSVWSVDPSGTLVQTDVHVPAGTTDTEGLNRAAGAAVTPDGSLLFVGSYYDSFTIGISTSQFTIGTSTLGIWRVNAEAPTVSFVRTLRDGQRLRNPRVVTLGPAGRFLFVSNQVEAGPATDPLSVYRVNAAGENLDPVASYGDDSFLAGEAIGLAATREVLAVAELQDGISLWQRNDDGTLRFADRHASASPVGLAASPAGGLVFSSSNDASEGISVWRVQGIPRVLAGQEVRVTVNAAQTPRSLLTVIVQARQGSRVRTAEATLMPPNTQADAVFSGRALGQGEWMFSASVPADMADGIDRTALSAARATLRITAPLIRLSNLSGEIPQGADLNIRVSTEGMVPVAGDAELTLRATLQGSTQQRTMTGLFTGGQTSVTVSFASENALTEGEWTVSAETSSTLLQTGANSTLAVTVKPPQLIRLSNLSGRIPEGADLNIRISTEGMVPVAGDAEVTLRATLQEGTQHRTVTGRLLEGQTSVTVSFAGGNALTEGEWTVSAETTSTLLQTDANISSLTVRVFIPPPLLTLSLQETAEPVVPAGSSLAVTVMADRPLMQDLTVTVQAVRTAAAPATVTTATATTQLSAGEEMGRAIFEGENVLSPGQWVLTIAGIMPEGSAEVSTSALQLQVRIGPSALGLSAPMDLFQGQDAVIEVDTEVALGVEVRVMVMATHADTPVITVSAAAVLEPSALAAEAIFPANMLSLVRRGTWNFEITEALPSVLMTDTESFPLTLVDFSSASATLQVTEEPSLFLELPPQPVNPAQPVSIRLQKSTTISEELTVDITAMRQFGGMMLTSTATALLSPSDTTAAAVFGPRELSAGRWTLTARVRSPGTVPVFPPTVTMTVRPPLLLLERLGPASVAAGTRITVRVAAEAMPEDEGLGVRVIARQAMRADIEISAVLGSQSDFSADVEFTSLPPGEWLLTAEAERPDAFRTEASTDMVTVEPAVLTLTPVLERVPAGESARLILGSIVPLGVAVNVTVVAEPVSLSSSLMTAVNLDEASTSAMVVYDPGELAPGIWNFNVQVMDAAVRMVANVSMATATLRIAAPLIRLANLSGVILQGDSLTIRVRTEGMIPVAGDAELTLRATLQESSQQRTVTGSLLEGQTSVTVSFAGENALTEGDWTVSAETASTLLQTDANLSSLTVIVGPPPRLLLERTGGSDIVDSDGTITLTLRLMPALSSAVMVTVAVADEDNNTISERQVALSSSLQLTFRASDLGTGRLRFTARGPEGVLEDSGAEVTVQVRARSTVELTLDAPARVTVGGEFTVAVGASEAMPVPPETTVMVAVSFEGVQKTAELTGTAPTTSVSFAAPAAAGEFSLELGGSAEVTDTLRVIVLGASAQIAVVPVQLTLSLEGPGSVQVGDAFSVTVGTGDDAVPAGTTVLVTVRDGTTAAEAVLTARTPTASVSFTAPARAGEVSVTATGVPETSSGSLEVAVSNASALAVTASPLQAMLTLSVPSSLVSANSTFEVTVGISPALSADASVEVEVTLGTASESAMLTGTVRTMTLEFMAPAMGGAVELRAGSVGTGGTLELNVLPTAATVQIQQRVPLSPSLNAPPTVSARGEFNVTVSTDIPVPAETTVTVTVGFDGAEREVVLTAAAASVITSFTAPARLEPGGLPVTATATVEMADADADILVVVTPVAAVRVRILSEVILLTLSEPAPNPVDAGESFTVTVGAPPALLTDTTITAAVTFNESTRQVTLSEREPESMVSFTAPASGTLAVTAVSVAVEPAVIVTVLEAVRSVQVRAMSTVELTLNAPASVTVGSSFTVAVGVSDTTPIPDGAELDVMLVLAEMLLSDADIRAAVLTDAVPTTSLPFVAPVRAGELSLELSGSVEVTDTLRVMVRGASAQIAVVPVQLTLSLEGPESVQVGEDFSVTAGTGDDAVPAGTTVLVTVSDGVTDEQAMLTARIPTASVSFTAPIRAGEVSVTATGVSQTSSGSLEVAVSDASPLAVTAFGVDVQLSLSGVPEGLVSARSTFAITVGVSGVTPVPAGTTVTVTVSFGDTFVGVVRLTREASESTVEVDVPDTGGVRELRAAGAGTEGGALDLNVLPAAATVRVRGEVELALQLAAPEAVQAGSAFDVDVSTDIPIPAAATVRVTVGFDGAEREVVLTAAVSSVTTSFTAPARLAPGGLPVTATAAVDVADPDILQVMVDTAAVAQVRVTALSVQLTLSEPDPNPVDAGQSFTVTAGVSPTLLANTTVAAVVTFNESTRQVTLSDRDPESMVTFTAPASGILEVTAAAAVVEPAGLVEVAAAEAQSVQVRAMSTVELTLDAPASVTVGGEFMVAVGVSDTTPIPAETAVMVTVSFEGAERTAVLTGTAPATSLPFAAPIAAREFSLALSGSAEVTDTLRVMVLGASTQIAVVPVQLTLSLAGPGSVQVGEDFMVTVGTGDNAVPAGTTVLVTVSDGTTNTEAVLTARTPTASVSFTAPARAGEVSVTATGVPQTSSGSLEVAVPDASSLAVTASPLQAMLTLSAPPSAVNANSLFDVIVGISPALPAGASVEVAVTFGTASERGMLTDTTATVTLAFRAPAMAGPVELRAESLGTGGALDLNVMPASLTLQVIAEPTLLLELPPQLVDPAQPVSIRLRKSTTSISERLTVDITAMRLFGERTLTRMAMAVLSPSDTTAAAVFGPGALSAGRWTLTASVSPPGTVPVFPPTATMTVRPPLLRLERLGPASVAAGTRITVRVEALAMPEDEGLGVRVIARQAMRADRERSAVLGSQPDFSADVEFTSLPPGEWLLTAEAERPDTFRTEGARDTVTVEPAALTLTPVLERVPAGESARLILGSVVPLGVAVNLNVVAEPVSPSFLPQTTAVNLDAAATSAMVVYDPGELAPGIWNFSVQVTDAAVRTVADVSMATATLRIAAPLIRLANLSGEILQGAELNIRVRTEGMVPVAGDAELTLRATLQESTQQRTVTGRLLEGQTSVTVTFAGEEALTEGEWTVSAETASTLLQTDANLSSLTVIVGPQPRLLLELTGGTIVASDGTITLILRLMPALSSTVMVTVAVTDEGSNTISEQQEALSSTLQLTFSASDLGTGRLRFTARGPAGVLEDSGAEVTVLVGTAVRVVLSANPEEDVFPGDEVRLSAAILSGEDPAGISVILEVAVAPPDGSTRSNVLIPVSAETSTGGLTFIPDAVPGTWTFTVIESDGISVSATLTVMVAAVVPLPLDFNNPSDGVSADDLVLLLRYERLCAGGGLRPLPASCTALGSEALAAGLAFESSPDRLADLQNVRLPDVTGTGVGSVQTLAILLQALANVQDELLLPAAASSAPETTIAEAEQARDARLRIIRQLLGRE